MKKISNEKFGENLKKALLMRQINQSDLANLLGINKSSVSAWVNGDSQPSSNRIPEICDALNVPEEIFFADDKDKPQTEYEELELLFNELNEAGRQESLRFLKILSQCNMYNDKIADQYLNGINSSKELKKSKERIKGMSEYMERKYHDVPNEDNNYKSCSLFLSKKDPKYEEIKARCQELIRIKKESKISYELIHYLLYKEGYRNINKADLIMIFYLKRVPSEQLFEKIYEGLTEVAELMDSSN